MVKIICLGNEFIKEDSLAKKIGKMLSEKGYEITNVKDSFELIEILNSKEDFIVIDVVVRLEEVREIEIKDLKQDSILTAHDFDAGFLFQLLGENKKIKIIGIPMNGNVDDIFNKTESLLKSS